MEYNENIHIGKYILRFAVVYLFVTLIVAAVLIIVDLNNNSLSPVILMLSAMMAGEKFIKDNKRLPNSSEKVKLISYSLLVAWLISFFLVGVTMFISPELLQVVQELISSLSYTIILGTILVISLLMILMLWFGYGFLTTRQLKALEKKGKL